MFVFDFDKTITNKHTRGAIFQPGQESPEELTKNFADLEFFRFSKKSLFCWHFYRLFLEFDVFLGLLANLIILHKSTCCLALLACSCPRTRRKIVPLMKQHAIVAIATFADTEEDSIISGITLVRAYLNVALGDNSAELIPGMLP